MPEYLAPGVYVEEIEIGAKPIEGVSTSTAGFLGQTERGPTTPRLVTSWLEYQRLFGSYFGSNQYLPYAVEGFFKNGGQRCYIARVVKSDATTSSLKLTSGGETVLDIEAIGEGSWGNRIAVKVNKGTFSGFKLSVFYWKKMPSELYDPEIDLTTKPRPDVIEVFDNLSTDESSPDYYEKKVNKTSNLIKINSVGELKFDEGTAQGGGTNSIKLADSASSENDAYNGMYIEITEGKGKGQVRKITDYDGSSKVATVDSNWDITPDDTSVYKLYWFEPLTGGSEGTETELDLADYTRTDTNEPGKRKGLSGLAEIDEISIVYSPNALAVEGLVEALISHCETLRDRFAIIDAKQGSSKISELKPRDKYDTKYAAFYYPWIKVINPETGLLQLVPPGGHIAGIYARTDTEKGVHKAPANETIRGIAGLEFIINKQEQDILNPRGVNCIRAFPGRGIRVWGARTLSSDPLWKYINVRRLFLFLEESIEKGTQWVVFEPNDERLWARVKQSITNFLTKVWKDGALMGSTPEEAFFVKCDRTTMTQDDIDNGRLICIIGVAPVKPAEFVIFRIAQWAGGSEISE